MPIRPARDTPYAKKIIGSIKKILDNISPVYLDSSQRDNSYNAAAAAAEIAIAAAIAVANHHQRG